MALHIINDARVRTSVRIRTDYIFPPIPVRSFDWQATGDSYEPGHPIGHGRTEQEAIEDLLEQMEDAA